MEEPAVIRPVRVEDTEDVARLFLESARHHVDLEPDLYRVPELDQVIQEHLQWLGRDDRAILVAEVGGRVVGSLSVRVVEPPGGAGMIRPRRSADIGITVTSELRGRGIGTRLMQEGEAWARDHGAEMLTLNGHVANTGALRLYERMGFRNVGFFMIKDLLPHPSGEGRGG
ncbi:MAG: GNAT family N-acetyltransferase, partial [Acidimicrobiia bacterium]